MVTWASQANGRVGVVAAVVIGAIALATVGCDAPARVKPWRHAPDPTVEAAAAPSSPVLADVPTEADLHAARVHTLRIHVDAEPGRLTPVVAPSVWARRITLGPVFEPLLRYLPADGNGPARFSGRLARTWQVMPSGLEIRLHLEPDVKFHDGHPLTSSDVQFTLDTIRDPHKGIDNLRPMLDDIFSIELITPTEVRLVLKRPSGWVLRALAEIPILPLHIYKDSLLGGGQLVGTGPYKVASNKGGVVHLARFDKYWGPAPAIADVEFVYQPDAAIALTAAKRGELDIIPALIPAHWPEQAAAPALAAAFRPLQLAPPRMRYLAFNAAKAPLDDPRVRHAIALLVDRRSIAKRVFDGLVRPALWPIWPGGPVDGAESPIPELDPTAASALLDAAGWTDSDKDGIRDRAGVPLKLIMIAAEHTGPKDLSGPPQKTERDLFVDAAHRAGLLIDVKTGGESWIAKRVEDGAYDLAELGWGGMVDMDLTPLLGDKNPAHAASARSERALDAMGAAWDPAERSHLASELTAALAETWPLAGIVADAPQGLVHRRVTGLKVWDGWFDLGALAFDPSVP